MPSTNTRRSYRSDLRAAQARRTRAAILSAATALFATKGWAATGMRDVARAAGVAVETVYGNFRSKANLLKEAIDVALVGEEAPVPVADRPEFLAMGAGTRGERAAAAASMVAALHRRSSGLLTALQQAAPTDPELTSLLRESRQRQLVTVRLGAQMLAARPVSDLEVHGLRAVLGHEVFLLLTDSSGWSEEQYQSWVAQMILRLLPSES